MKQTVPNSLEQKSQQDTLFIYLKGKIVVVYRKLHVTIKSLARVCELDSYF